MKISAKRQLFSHIPEGLTPGEVGLRLGFDPQKARRLIHQTGYRAADGRKFSQQAYRKVVPETLDWSVPNAELARTYGVSRERIRVLRNKMGQPFVEARGRRPKKDGI